ncbi:DUF916 and DUF3324 domain-containing protein [Listeria fleischmannii]|uniref:DUF916 and DUF3324 domain-containing protein n=1 Tax=Listeria fleischmannii TaxID=1069827 RepID=UPI0016268098|nr:DUF916 and DUF3324 domain-containing protein [Listeria fleischmannii]MBC1417667.1 DUF916 and DUF3324 domain-containing protein [Listeria fleischmannii]
MKKFVISILLGLLFLGLSFLPVKAEASSTMNFSVNAVIPDNQIDKSKTYFDLKMKPGETRNLEVILTNGQNHAITIETNANTAVTNDNGIVDYSKTNPNLDASLKIPFSEIAKMDKEITLPANGTKTVKVNITMPKEEYDGQILGGLHFTEKLNQETEKNEEGVQIKNLYAYVIGVLLTENDKEVKPDMQLGEIKPSQINYRNVLKANLQNSQPIILKNLNIQARVTKKGSNKTLHETNKTDMRMAPNSNFNYGINWENQEFKAGKYTLHMTAKSNENEWKWTKDFEIKGDEAKALNNKAVELEKDYTIWYIIGAILLGLILLILVFLLGKRSSRKKDD